MTKILKLNGSGSFDEYEPIATSSGAPDAGQIPKTGPDGKFDMSLFPANVGADELSLTASEAISAGDYLYIKSDGSVAKADASSLAKAAVCYAIEAVAALNPVKIRFDDSNTHLSGLTPGVTYFLSGTTAGAVTTTAPTTSGHIVQKVGTAINVTSIHSDIASTPVVRV